MIEIKVKIAITPGEIPYELTYEQARKLYEELRPLFENKPAWPLPLWPTIYKDEGPPQRAVWYDNTTG